MIIAVNHSSHLQTLPLKGVRVQPLQTIQIYRQFQLQYMNLQIKKNKLYNVVRYRYSIIHHVLLLYHERIKYATLTCTFLYDN